MPFGSVELEVPVGRTSADRSGAESNLKSMEVSMRRRRVRATLSRSLDEVQGREVKDTSGGLEKLECVYWLKIRSQGEGRGAVKVQQCL